MNEQARPQKRKKVKPTLGWREWVRLPELGIDRIKAKVDTGARSSSIHAMHLEVLHRDGKQFVRFQVHPVQRSSRDVLTVQAEILEFRDVKSSSGQIAKRPVIVTPVYVAGQIFSIELTLAPRDTMGFRMLLGRQAVRRRFLIDPGRSYYGGKLLPSQEA